MKILWIGKYASEEIFEEMALKGYKDPAAQVSQSNIISALDELGMSPDTLNAYNVSDSYADKYIKPRSWSRTGASVDKSIGFRNIKYISHILRTQSLKHEAKLWSEENGAKDEVTVLVYGLQSSLLSAAMEVKKNIAACSLYLIVPDLPQYMDLSMSFIKRFLKRIDWFLIKQLLKYVDGYILYTKHMAKFLNLENENWMLMEGSINTKDISQIENRGISNKITVMYSGKLDKKYGIIELLEAIELIDSQVYEFWFTGMGNATPNIEEAANKDQRIKYFGFLPSREALLKKQQEATMLINMRLPTEKGSAYCFPSKIFEYMASGRPVLSFRTPGIPDDYYKYLIEIKSTAKEDIMDAIKYVGNMSEEDRKIIGVQAKEFVVNSKTAVKQAQKIINFIISNQRDRGKI